MKHHITIEIPSAPNEKAAIAKLRALGRSGRLIEFVVSCAPVGAKPKVNPMLRKRTP